MKEVLAGIVDNCLINDLDNSAGVIDSELARQIAESNTDKSTLLTCRLGVCSVMCIVKVDSNIVIRVSEPDYAEC